MIFEVNGINLLPFIDDEGIEITRNDLDGAEAGRTMDGIMHRARVAVKTKINVTCKPLTTAKAQTVLNAIFPEYVTVKYEDPRTGVVQKEMYSNNVPATVAVIYDDGTTLWRSIKFPLIER